MNAPLDLELDAQLWQQAHQTRIEAVLEGLLPPVSEVPGRLHTAMRYAVLGGGKRIRPLLAYAAGEAMGRRQDRVDFVAAAVEFIHCYSLIHDDLPCMDDDVLRRGRPTVHVQFDQATALLAGDALQSLAFVTLANLEDAPLRMASVLALAAGSRGMAGGQAIDLESVGASLAVSELEQMHRMKTGALIAAAVTLGGWCGEVVEEKRLHDLEHYSTAIGLAFQIVDDILDTQATTEALGKTAGKDAAQNKPTYVSLLGLEGAKARAAELRDAAYESLMPFGVRARRLRELADLILLRQS